MTHYKHLILSAMAVPLAGLALSSCATISEDECIAGSWQDIGYNDGRAGNSRGRFADIASTCAKYDVIPNRNAYMSGYDSGLPLYCTFDNGISRGESGGDPNQECIAINATPYLEGHAEGYAVYQITSEHQSLIDDYEDALTALIEVRRRLDEEDNDADERRRLRKKEIRLDDRREDLRIEVRALERQYGLPRYDF
ncbi:DUF2799 domain-containing protein [Litorimonas sp. RW-G-Af-16]|uniref:DUF2799 domain-containing protein n=1 Tax=Litorimonas sp. RW-G-Af-16 TaxID=3241168 RepID=UPI00390CD2ED